MRHIRLKCSTIILLGLGLTGLKAQTTVSTTGGKGTGVGGTMSYSVGQIVYTTNKGTNGSESQGVQQPFEISEVTGIEQAKDITLQCSVYPNPTNDLIMLKVENFELSNFNFQLFDIRGKLLETKKINDVETSINMISYQKATYFIKVIDNNKEVKSFKIIKK
jgi:hypothetical protein